MVVVVVLVVVVVVVVVGGLVVVVVRGGLVVVVVRGGLVVVGGGGSVGGGAGGPENRHGCTWSAVAWSTALADVHPMSSCHGGVQVVSRQAIGPTSAISWWHWP